MFDTNHFKRAVKDWMKQHPEGSEAELTDFCEELIPVHQFAAHRWLVDHTVSWYRHVVAHRNQTQPFEEEGLV
jgi:hypothetical protein